MDSGFFASKYFVISAVVASLLLGAGAAAYAVGGISPSGGGLRLDRGCDRPTLSGTPLAAAPEVVDEDGGERRTVTYRLDPGATTGGALDLCLVVGELVLERSAGQAMELVFTIASESASAVAATDVAAAFHQDAARGLVVGAWEGLVGRHSTMFGGDSPFVRLVVRVPDTGAWHVRARTDVGDVRASGLLVGDLDVRTDVGNADLSAIDLQGNATVATEVGNVVLDLASVQPGAIEASSDVGDVEVHLPTRADVGYDAHGATDVGEVELTLGAVEGYQSEGDGPGETESARTAGYADKPTKVRVRGLGNVGDVRIIAE